MNEFDLDEQLVQSLTSVAELPDGDLIASGYSLSADATDSREYLVRFNADGSLDGSFGNGGTLLLEDFSSAALVTQVVALPDGDILYARDTSSGGRIGRLNPDGTADTAFGTDGLVEGLAFPPVIALAPDGDFVLAGNPANDPEAGLVIQVYDADGTLRSASPSVDLFDLTALENVDFADVAIAPVSGGGYDIYIAGNARPASPLTDRSVSIFRVNGDDLTLDTGFGSDGRAERTFDSLEEFNVVSIEIDPLGRPVVGVGEDDSENRVLRFSTNGTLEIDQPFRFAAPYVFGASNEVAGVRVQPDGKLLVAGYVREGSDQDAGVARLLTNANRDTLFGDGSPGPGDARYDFGSEDDLVTDFIITEDGDAVLVGRRRFTEPSPAYDAVIYKIDLGDIGSEPDPDPDPDPGPDPGPDPDPEPPAFANLDGSTLRIDGDSGSNQLNIVMNGNEIVVTRTTGSEVLDARFNASAVDAVVVEAGAGNDDITYGLGLPSTLRGGDGDDSFVGGSGADVFEGGAGEDIVNYAGRTANLNLTLNGTADDGAAGEGDNLLSGIEGVLAGSGNDVISLAGLSGSGMVDAGAGNDTVTGSASADSIELGDGNDSTTGGGGDDLISGGAGNDTLSGGGGADSLFGEAGEDDLVGNAGADLLDGGAGTDRLRVLAAGASSDATDTLVGGDGERDIADFSDFPEDLRVRLTEGEDGDDEPDGFLKFSGGSFFGFADALARIQGIGGVVTGSGNDSITGRFGGEGDVLDGGAGNDEILGHLGIPNSDDVAADDTIIGGAGNDIITGSGDLDGGEGQDQIYLRVWGGTNASARGGAGDDYMEAIFLPVGDLSGARHTFDGGDGDDQLIGGRGTLIGGAGNDLLATLSSHRSYPDPNDTPSSLLGGEGNDTLHSELESGALFDGEAGDDLLRPSRGSTVFGGDGEDVVDPQFSATTFRFASDGDAGDGLLIGPDVETILGTDGDDIFDASDMTTPVTLMGGLGNDQLIGGSAADVLLGGEGDDTLTGGAGDDRIYGQAGDDSLNGGTGRDSLRAGIGNDSLDGGDGNDLLLPGASSDESDVVTGGTGADILHYRESTQDNELIRGTLEANGGTSAALRVSQDVEVALGGSGDDLIEGFIRSRGGVGNDTLEGAANVASALFGDEGNDSLAADADQGNFLDGGAGDDTLATGDGNDTLATGIGTDSLTDTGGINDLSFADATEAVTVDLRQESNVLDDSSPFGTIAGRFRHVLGSIFNDVIIASDTGHWLGGNDGDDTLRGASGHDVLQGGAGADLLDGGDANDLLKGAGLDPDDGAVDTLIGGGGFDRVLASDEDEVSGAERITRSLDELLNSM